MDSLNASAKLRWKGYHGRIEGDVGLARRGNGDPGGAGRPGRRVEPRGAVRRRPRQLLHLDADGMARAREIPLGEIETAVQTTLSWGDGTHHHLSDATLHTRVASPAPEEQVRGADRRGRGRVPGLPGDLRQGRAARHGGRRHGDRVTDPRRRSRAATWSATAARRRRGSGRAAPRSSSTWCWCTRRARSTPSCGATTATTAGASTPTPASSRRSATRAPSRTTSTAAARACGGWRGSSTRPACR